MKTEKLKWDDLLNNQPKCKSIVSENIDNVIEGKALTAPLKFLKGVVNL